MEIETTSAFCKEEQSSQLEKEWEQMELKFENLEDQFEARTKYLMNGLCLVAGNRFFRIVDCEVYYNSEPEHQDPYCHKDEEQLNSGTWFFNYAGGLDITFGNRNKKIYASILIRAIRNLQTNQFIDGVTKVVKEIFKQFGSVFREGNEIRLCELNPQFITHEELFRTTRVNLTKKVTDMEGFVDRPYRYIIESNLSPTLKGKDKIVTHLVQEGKI